MIIEVDSFRTKITSFGKKIQKKNVKGPRVAIPFRSSSASQSNILASKLLEQQQLQFANCQTLA